MEDPAAQSLEVEVRDSHLTGRSVLGRVRVPLTRLPSDSTLDAWLPVEGIDGGRAGEIHLQMTYKVVTSDTCLEGLCVRFMCENNDILLTRTTVGLGH